MLYLSLIVFIDLSIVKGGLVLLGLYISRDTISFQSISRRRRRKERGMEAEKKFLNNPFR